MEMEAQGHLIPAGNKLVPTETRKEIDKDVGSDKMTKMPERDADKGRPVNGRTPQRLHVNGRTPQHPNVNDRTPQRPDVNDRTPQTIPVEKEAVPEKDSHVHKPDEKKCVPLRNVERRAGTSISVDRDPRKQRTERQKTEKGKETRKAHEGEEAGTEWGVTSKDTTSRKGRRSGHSPDEGVKRQRLSDAESQSISSASPTNKVVSKTSKTAGKITTNQQLTETSVTKIHTTACQTTKDAFMTGHDTTQKRDTQLLSSPATVPACTCGGSPAETPVSTSYSKYNGPTVGLNFVVAVRHKKRYTLFCRLCMTRPHSRDHMLRHTHRVNYVKFKCPELTAPLSDTQLLKIATELAEKDTGDRKETLTMDSEEEYEDLTRRTAEIPKDNETSLSPLATGSQSSPMHTSPTDTQPESQQSCDVQLESSQDPKTRQREAHNTRAKPRAPRDTRTQSQDLRKQTRAPQHSRTQTQDLRKQTRAPQHSRTQSSSPHDSRTQSGSPRDSVKQQGAPINIRTQSGSPHDSVKQQGAHQGSRERRQAPQGFGARLQTPHDCGTRPMAQKAPQHPGIQPPGNGTNRSPLASGSQSSPNDTQPDSPQSFGVQLESPQDPRTRKRAAQDTRKPPRAFHDTRTQPWDPLGHMTFPTDTQSESPQSFGVQLESPQDPRTRQRAVQDTRKPPWALHDTRTRTRLQPDPQGHMTQPVTPEDSVKQQGAPEGSRERQEAPPDPGTMQQTPHDCGTRPVAPQYSGTSQRAPGHISSIDPQETRPPRIIAFWNQEQFYQVDGNQFVMHLEEDLEFLYNTLRVSSCPPVDQQPPVTIKKDVKQEDHTHPCFSGHTVKHALDYVSPNGDAKRRRISKSPDVSGTCDGPSGPCSNVSSIATQTQCPSRQNQVARVKVEPTSTQQKSTSTQTSAMKTTKTEVDDIMDYENQQFSAASPAGEDSPATSNPQLDYNLNMRLVEPSTTPTTVTIPNSELQASTTGSIAMLNPNPTSQQFNDYRINQPTSSAVLSPSDSVPAAGYGTQNLIFIYGRVYRSEPAAGINLAPGQHSFPSRYVKYSDGSTGVLYPIQTPPQQGAGQDSMFRYTTIPTAEAWLNVKRE